MTNIDIKQAKEALDSLDDYARMDVGVDAIGPRGVLEKFIASVEAEQAVKAVQADEVSSLVQSIVAGINPGQPHGGENLCRLMALLSFVAIAAVEEDGGVSVAGIRNRMRIEELYAALQCTDGVRGDFARA